MKLKGIIFLGGLDINKIGNCFVIFEYYDEFNVLIFGICFGYQFIVKYFGGKVGRGEKVEYSFVEIEIFDENDIFRGFLRKLRVWESYMDEVKEFFLGFKFLVRSEICFVEVMKYESFFIYGVQFYLEVVYIEYGVDIYCNFVELCGEF